MNDWRKSLEQLQIGNERFAASRMKHSRQDAERREELLEGQAPFAVVLACSDSRVTPEILFDQGLGDIFVIRVAGNIIDDVVIASIEYAAAHLATPLIVVLGHSSCGAITATAAGGDPGGHLPSLTRALAPAVEAVRHLDGDLVNNAAQANARRIAAELGSTEPVLAGKVGEGSLKILGAYYDLESGRVSFLDED
ncbi:MAG: carbonic anhydrase [bacterium]|nr:carbonic anhydrase [bacterium]